MRKADLLFALALLVAAACGFVSQAEAASRFPPAAQGDIADALSPPILSAACVTVLGQRLCIDDDNGGGGEKKKKNKEKKSSSGNNQSGPTSCGPNGVLYKSTTSDGRLVTKCVPGAKQDCGPDEVLYKSTTSDGRLVTKCLKK